MDETPLSRYQQDLLKPDFCEDIAQKIAVAKLQDLYQRLINAPKPRASLWERLGVSQSTNKTPIKGLYFWGGVGRGKTYLADTFFDCLPFEDKLRMHFHRFMRRVHQDRKQYKNEKDPLVLVAKQIAQRARVLCFDEFAVSDVADAVILSKLIENLFNQGVTLVATSNVEPKKLYAGGLQRDLFLPAIDLISENTEIFNLDNGIDYRLLFLEKAQTWFSPLNGVSCRGMRDNFDHLAPEPGEENASIEIEGRDLISVRRADGVIWFEFAELCDGPRSQDDYIELARCFHSVLVSEVPKLDRLKEDQAKRFINLVDILYDHRVKLIVSADAPLLAIYQGSRLSFEIQRTYSRLQEMQSLDYLAQAHIT